MERRRQEEQKGRQRDELLGFCLLVAGSHPIGSCVPQAPARLSSQRPPIVDAASLGRDEVSLRALPSSRQPSSAPTVTETFLYASAAKLLSPLSRRLTEGRFGGQRGLVMGSLVPYQCLEQDLPLYCLHS